MYQFIMITLSMITSLLFMQMKHPLAMGMMLLVQSTIICLITGTLSKTFWFSYILFLIFLGGMLVLFIYVTTLASNEMFNFSMKIFYFSMMMIITFNLMSMIIDFSTINSYLMNLDMNLNLKFHYLENTTNLMKLYNFPMNLMTIILINYLFLTLIIIVKITNNFKGPLRMMN